MGEESKIVFGNWEPIKLKSWTYSTTEDFVPETIDDCDPNPTIEGEEMVISADKLYRQVERMVCNSGFKGFVEKLENEFGVKPDTFESLLDRHCQKSDVAIYLRTEEVHQVYKHKHKLYFVLTGGVVYLYTLSALSKVITNTDWLFSFSEPARLKAFLESLPLDEN